MNRALTAEGPAAPSVRRRALPILGCVLRLTAREQRAWLVGLPVLTGVVTALLAPAYSDIYATEADLRRAVAGAQGSEAQLFLYGSLSPQAGITQIMFWEVGSLACLVLGVVVVLRAVACSRGEEDLGRGELLEAAGARAVVRLCAQGTVLACECLLVSAAAGVGMLRLKEADGTAAAAYAGTLALTFLLLSAVSLVIAQVATDAAAARTCALVVLAATFTGSGLSASQGWDWLGWFSPFALRSRIDPGGDNSWSPALWALAALGVLIGATAVLAARRDLGLGALRIRAPWSALRLRALGPGTVFTTLVLGQCATWALIICAVSGMLTAMGENLVEMVRQGALSGEGSLGAFLDGTDPAIDYLRYVGALAGALAAGQAIALAGRYGADERSGRLEAVIATGVRPWRAMLAWWLAAVLAAAVSLGLAALVAGGVGTEYLGTQPEDAVRLVLGQWPATVAAGGLSSALCGLAPRARGLAWAPGVVGFGITQLGAVLDLSRRVRDAAPFVQAGQVGSLWLLGLGLLGVAAGLAGVRRRDLRPFTAAP